MTDTKTNQNAKKLQIFLIRHEQLKSYTFTDAVEEKTHIWFKKHKTLDSFEGYWDKEKLGVVIDDFFTINARVAFYESEDMTEKAIELLKEHLEKQKAAAEEVYKTTLQDIERLEKELSDQPFKK